MTRADEIARRRHLADLENMLAGPIPEPGLRERIRAEYIAIRNLEANV